MFNDVWSDVRYSARRLLAAPGASAIAVLTLVVGIAANTTMFSVANAVLLTPMAASQPDRIVALFTSTDRRSPYRSSSYVEYADLREPAGDVLSDFAIYGLAPVDLQDETGARVAAGTVSGNYFRLLGAPAMLGRTIVPDDDRPGNPAGVAVLNEALWREHFGADPAIVGKTIRLNRQVVTVIGVVARPYAAVRRFFEVDVFVPLGARPALTGEPLDRREARQFFLLGRLKPEITIAAAQARMTVAAGALGRAAPDRWRRESGEAPAISVIAERDARVPPSARLGAIAFFAFLQAMVGVVLLVACANLANLALARALGREHEIAVRVAVGASRWRLLRQMLVESALVAGVGAVGALMVTRWAVAAISAASLHAEVTFHLGVGLDYRVLAFALLVTVATALLFGLAPALHATRPDVAGGLKTGSGARFGLRNALIVGEVALCVVLLVPAGLFVRSVQRVDEVDLGFDARNLALMSVSLDPVRYAGARGITAYGEMLMRVRAVPGVVAADVAGLVPLSGAMSSVTLRGAAGAPPTVVASNAVGPEYFVTMGTPLLRGRPFSTADAASTPAVAIVNQALVDAHWPRQDAVGKHLVLADARGTVLEVVGVVRTGKYESVSEDPTPYLYRPIAQDFSSVAVVHVRTRENPASLLRRLAAQVQQVDPSAPVYDLKTMNEQLATSVGPFRTMAAVLVVFGVVGLALACVGLYGVIAYATVQRRKEIAVRMAVGAARRDIMTLMARQGARLVASGLLLGIPLAAAVALLVSRFLFGVSAWDAITYGAVSLTLGAVGAAAVAVPSYRATTIEPFEVLRAP